MTFYTYKRFTNKDGIRHYQIPELNHKKLPSSTTITGQLDKPALVQWASNMAVTYFQERILDDIETGKVTIEDLKKKDLKFLVKEAKMYHKKKKEDAADLGSRTHHWIQAYFEASEGEEVTFDPDMEKAVSAFMEWYLKYEVHPLTLNINGKKKPAIELMVWSKEAGGYAGTLDLVAYVRDPGKAHHDLTVIDFKTAKGIYPDMAMQVSSYFYAFIERWGIQPIRSAIVRLDKETGFPEYCPFTDEENERAFRKFKLLCQLYHEDDHKRKVA